MRAATAPPNRNVVKRHSALDYHAGLLGRPWNTAHWVARMTTELSTILAIIAAVAIAVAGVGVWWINRVPVVHRDESETIPLFTGLGPAGAAEPAEPSVMSAASPRTLETASPPSVASVGSPGVPTPDAPVLPRPTIREFTTVLAPTASREPLIPAPATQNETSVLSDTGVPGTMVEGHAVRFSVPAEGTLQFLPGRLEIGSGVDTGREIRFVQVPGADGTDVTFGRVEGALYRHIQLRDKTVSRQHAVLQWRDGHWYLRNLSQTNPVTHNGVALDTFDRPCLQDGDRVEMGEVIFTFRSR